jgi:hypothetical protein
MPTVIPSGGPSGSPTTPKPTVIGAPPSVGATKPTVIGGAPLPKATTIGSTAPPLAPAPVAAAPATPTKLPGKGIARAEVTSALIAAANPATKEEAVLNRAVAIVKSVDLSELCGNAALLWGQPTQERHAALVDEGLTLAQDGSLEQARRHVARIMEILSGIHLDRVFAATKKGVGALVAGLAGRATAATDTPEELESALRELGQIVNLLRATTGDLASLRGKVQANAEAIVQNGKEVEASLCAAAFLAGYVRGKPADFKPDTATHLDARAQSLTATLASIAGHGGVRQAQADNPVSFIQLIQDVALVSLPDWISTITAAKTAAASRPVNPTEVGVLADGLQKVMAALARR